MSFYENREESTLYKEVSERDLKPDSCIFCKSSEFSIATHKIRDLQDLGTPTRKCILRHEQVWYKCKKCGKIFRVLEPSMPTNTSYSDDVKIYAFHRILKEGDSTRRVARDLRKLHSVEIEETTIGKWVRGKTREDLKPSKIKELVTEKYNVKGLTCDGTFRAVSLKKNEKMTAENVLSWLHLTRLKNGKLVAILPLERTRKR